MSLENLRQRLNELDRQIVELIAERQSVVDEVGRHKVAAGTATRDFTREKEVLDAARLRAEKLGVDPDVAELVMQQLIETSLTKQERARVRAEGQGAGRKALVIGGGGKMGRWFVDFLDSQGYAVTIADPGSDAVSDDAREGVQRVTDWREAGDDYAVTVVAAPLQPSAKILEEMAERGHSGLIFDIGSLKTPLIPALRSLAASGAQVTSVHPMFGPDAELLSGRHVLFMEVGCPEATAEARALFTATMAQQSEMELEDHDRLIAYILGLSHALNIAFFGVLARSGESVPSLADMSSTTFDSQLAVASRVAQENPQLYFEIQSLNKHGLEPLEGLQEVLQSMTDMIREGREQDFVRLMEQGREYLENRG